MKMKCCLSVALVAGSVFTASAVAQKHAGPASGPAGRATPAHAPKVLQPNFFGARRIEPVSIATFRTTPDGHMILTSPVMPYQPRQTDDPTTSAFDIFQADATGAPTGADGACALPGPGYRYWQGATWISAEIVNDFQVAAGTAGQPLGRVDLAWNWGAGATRPMSIALTISDTFRDCATGIPPSSGPITGGGVIVNYAPQAGGAGYFYSNVGLVAPFLNVSMPADGNGAYQLMIGSYDAGTQVFTLDLTPGTQHMLWGSYTGSAGVHGPLEWEDDGGAGTNTSDGTFAADECYTWAGAVPCTTLGAMIGFWVDAGAAATGACCTSSGCQVLSAAACTSAQGTYNGDNTTCSGPGQPSSCCYANCDGSTTSPCLNVLDFGCFLNAFAANNAYANCDNSTTAPVLNVLDFGCFLNKFAAACSNC